MRYGVMLLVMIAFAPFVARGATTAPATTRAASGRDAQARDPQGRDAVGVGVPQAREILRALDNLAVPPGRTCKWSDLVRLSVHDGRLTIESRVSKDLVGDMAERKPVDLEIENAADKFWRLQTVPQPAVPIGPMPVGRVVMPRPRPAPGAAIDFYLNARIRGKSDTPRLSTVMLMGGTFRLGCRLMSGDKFYVVDFRSYTNKSNVMLTVRENTRGRRGQAGIALDAADLRQLRHEHPAEVRTYLDPLLSEVCGGANPMRPRAGDVYRAFTAIAADSATFERVKAIVMDFDVLEPAVREAASKQLEALGRPGVLAAARIDRTDLSGEQLLRLDAFIARHSTLGEVEAARRDPLFLADCLADEDRAVRAAALEQLRGVSDHAIEFDVDAPAAERLNEAAAVASQFFPKATELKPQMNADERR